MIKLIFISMKFDKKASQLFNVNTKHLKVIHAIICLGLYITVDSLYFILCTGVS